MRKQNICSLATKRKRENVWGEQQNVYKQVDGTQQLWRVRRLKPFPRAGAVGWSSQSGGMHRDVGLIRQSNWLNICSCCILILKWAFSLCMPGMPKRLSAFLMAADCGVCILTTFNCTEIQVIHFKVKCSIFPPFFCLHHFEGKDWKYGWRGGGVEWEVLQATWAKVLVAKGESLGENGAASIFQGGKTFSGPPGALRGAKAFTSSLVPHSPLWVYYLWIICVHA